MLVFLHTCLLNHHTKYGQRHYIESFLLIKSLETVNAYRIKALHGDRGWQLSHFGNIGHHLIVAIIDHIPNGCVMFNGDI
jgi:hypothetical protein